MLIRVILEAYPNLLLEKTVHNAKKNPKKAALRAVNKLQNRHQRESILKEKISFTSYVFLCQQTRVDPFLFSFVLK